MTDRFTVAVHGSTAYYVKDNDGRKYGMPEMACSMYFQSLANAQKVSAILNSEWRVFNNNPGV